MPKFAYTVKDINGRATTDVADAFDQHTLVLDLQKRGYFIVSVKELKASDQIPQKQASAKVKRFTHKKILINDLIIFARQLTTMIESGVTLLRSLDVIISQIESEELYKTLSKIKDDVEQGSSLSKALEKHPKVFNQFWISLVEVGEASGTMPTILDKLAFYLEQQAGFRSTIVSAIIYPMILFTVSMGAIMFFALVVGPKFESIFKSMNVPLPMITQILLTVFGAIKKNFLLLVGSTIVFFVIVSKYLQTYSGRIHKERILMGLPAIGETYKLIILERFASQMAILIDSGVPILYALDISQRLVDNHTCSLILGDVKEGIRQGKSLTGPMQKSGFFPPMAIQMIAVGEETGELSKMFKHVAQYYQTAVETFMKRLGTVIEPVMLVFMGSVIGVILVAMFLPMFNISQLGGGGGGG